ncbi:MAG: tetratricopeptide repeat protein [Methylococcales bacterium]
MNKVLPFILIVLCINTANADYESDVEISSPEIAKEAEQGNVTAQFVLGGLYRQLAKKNEEKAFFWSLKAAKQGNVLAQTWVVAWYLKAAEQGESPAQYALGNIYYSGSLGVAKDEALAIMWWRKATQHNDNLAKAARDALSQVYSNNTDANLQQMQKELALKSNNATLLENLGSKLLFDLAFSYPKEENYERAEPLFKRGLEIMENASDKDNLNAAYILNGLATLYMYQHKYEKAEPLYLRCLPIMEKFLGKDHATTKSVIYTLQEIKTK